MKNSVALRFLWQHIRPQKWYYLIMLLGPVFYGFYGLLYNYSIKVFLDLMESKSEFTIQNLAIPFLLFLAIQLSLSVVFRISGLAARVTEPKVRRSILLGSYKYVQNHSYEFFQNNYTGTVSGKLKALIDGYDKIWGEFHHGLLTSFLIVTINMIYLLSSNPYLAGFIIVWLLIFLPVLNKMTHKMLKLVAIESDCRHRIMGMITDNIVNIITLFSFTSKRREYKRLDNHLTKDFVPKQQMLYKNSLKLELISNLFYIALFLFVLSFLIYQRIQGNISIGDFAFILSLTFIIVESSWDCLKELQKFSHELGELNSALSILNTPNEIQDSPETPSLRISSPAIDIQSISFSYSSGKNIFHNLSLHIKAGEKVGLVGTSGAGKSTLVKLLLRYFQLKQGNIKINGTDIQSITKDSLRSQIAVIPQDTLLFHRNITENILYGKPTATREELIEASEKAHIHDFILELPEQYDTVVGERGIKLSGGQRQRISIARAILKDAPILILDEATSALDSKTEKLIQDSLKFFLEDKNKTVIAIAHRLSTLKHMDRIIVLHHGTIVEEGTHDELIQYEDGLYRELWKYQELI